MARKALPPLSTVFVLGLLAATFGVGLAEAQVFTIITSDAVLYQNLELPNGAIAQVSRMEGGLVTVEELSSGVKYGFVARREPGKSNLAKFLLLDIREEEGSVTEMENFLLATRKEETLTTPIGAFKVQFTGVDKPGPRTWYLPDSILTLEDAEQKALAFMFQPLCCVICDGFAICADSVSIHCGSCGGGGGQYK